MICLGYFISDSGQWKNRPCDEDVSNYTTIYIQTSIPATQYTVFFNPSSNVALGMARSVIVLIKPPLCCRLKSNMGWTVMNFMNSELPSGWILLTLFLLWSFLKHHQRLRVFTYTSNNLTIIHLETSDMTTGWTKQEMKSTVPKRWKSNPFKTLKQVNITFRGKSRVIFGIVGVYCALSAEET